jgi:hypothetical protein
MGPDAIACATGPAKAMTLRLSPSGGVEPAAAQESGERKRNLWPWASSATTCPARWMAVRLSAAYSRTGSRPEDAVRTGLRSGGKKKVLHWLSGPVPLRRREAGPNRRGAIFTDRSSRTSITPDACAPRAAGVTLISVSGVIPERSASLWVPHRVVQSQGSRGVLNRAGHGAWRAWACALASRICVQSQGWPGAAGGPWLLVQGAGEGVGQAPDGVAQVGDPGDEFLAGG